MTDPIIRRVVKDDFVYRFSHGGFVRVPEGAPVSPIKDEPGQYWVDPKAFAGQPFGLWDASHYGVRVDESNTVEVPLAQAPDPR